MLLLLFFFFNDTATTEIYTLSLPDALPISSASMHPRTPVRSGPPPPADSTPAANRTRPARSGAAPWTAAPMPRSPMRSEEHTSELQSHSDLVCRLLLEKKKKPIAPPTSKTQ